MTYGLDSPLDTNLKKHVYGLGTKLIQKLLLLCKICHADKQREFEYEP